MTERKSFTAEFKREAVRLATERDNINSNRRTRLLLNLLSMKMGQVQWRQTQLSRIPTP